MHVSKLSEFIQWDVPSNTLLLIPNEFGTLFELGVQRLETVEETRNTIFAGTREDGARNNFAQRVIRKHLRSHRILFACLLPFLYRCNPLYLRNINYVTILVHGTTVHR